MTLRDLMQCCENITPLAIQDAASVERMQSWAGSARAASSPITQQPKSLRTPRFRNNFIKKYFIKLKYYILLIK
ncbi:hypothetical protein H6G97_36055 [Nostoc flagelliforme FACHB-838]|uniref:Uncharacterized protein n=1 Tax=Nostoc flagelliforme FACHB-838 TaxID=2692904 RepID=A0ABR8DZL4_9NOSO|nr:hypothetical protein [Nostoc flagelliforme FACHB-838]